MVCGASAGGEQFPRICSCVGMGDMWGRAALSSGPVACDTCGPDSSSSSPAAALADDALALAAVLALAAAVPGLGLRKEG